MLRIWMMVGLLGTAGSAWAQNPVFQQGPNFGNFSIGEVAIPLNASGGASPGNYTWQVIAGSLPPGVSLRTDTEAFPSWFPANTPAALLGVATVPSTTAYAFTLRVTSGATSSTQNAQIRISPLVITEPWTLPRAYVGKPFSYQLTTENGAAAVTWSTPHAASLAGLGLTLSPQGLISGTPTASGFLNVQLDVTDGTTVTRWINIEIFQIEITSPAVLPNVIQGQFYNVTLTAARGTGPYTWALANGNNLPQGLVLDPVAGTITGITTQFRGPVNFVMNVTDANQVTSWKRMVIDVIRAPQGAPRLFPYFSGRWQDCTLGWPCDLGVSVFNGGTAPFTFAISGQPRGLFLSSTDWWTPTDVMITGAPAELGDFNITVTATDAVGVSTTIIVPLHVSSILQRGDSFKPLDLVDGTLDVPYSKKLSVTGGVVPYSASIVSGALPPGLTFDPATFIVSGTPTAAGGFSPVFEYADGAGNKLWVSDFLFIDASFASGGAFGTIDINSFFDLGTATLNSSFSRTLTACCAPSFLWTNIDPLPPDLALSPDGTLSGTPTVAGTYTFKIRAADGQFPAANYAEQRFTLRVASFAPSPFTNVTPGTLPFGNVGTVYNTQILDTSTGGAITWTVPIGSFLPPGITLAPNGALSGSPDYTGQFGFNLVATDQVGNTQTRFFTLFVFTAGQVPPLDLNIGPSIGAFSIGQITLSLTATGGVAPLTYSVTPGAPVVPGMRVQSGQPLPLGFTAHAVFIGIVTQPGTYTTSIRVTDSTGAVLDRPVTLTVLPLQTLAQNPLPRAAVGTPYSYTFAPYGTVGFTGPFTFTATGLPPGLTLTSGGTLQGTPTSAGNFTSVRVVLREVPSAIEFVSFYTLTVDHFAIGTGGDLPGGRVGIPYNQPLSAPGCVNCNWTISGGLPAGLTFSSTGLISGTPTATTTNTTFTLTANGSNGSAQRLFRIQIAAAAPQPLSIATTQGNFGDRSVGGTIANTLLAQGGTPPYNWSLDAGALPTGTNLGMGEQLGANQAPGVTHVAGRLMEVGLFTFTLRVTDAVGASTTRTLTLNVSPLNVGYFSFPILTAPVFNPLTLGVPYVQAQLGIGGDGVYTYANTSPMPPGLALDPNTGIVSGTPVDTGFFSVPIRITDGNGETFLAGVTFNIAGPTGTLINFGQAANIGTVQKAFNFSRNLTLSGGTPPYTVVAETPLPPGIALADGASLLVNQPAGSWFLIGTPLAEGTFTFRLRATDSVGNVGARTFTLSVAPFGLISNTTLPDGSVGVAYSQTLFAAAENGNVTWSVPTGSSLPAGLTLTPAGALSGTPTQSGTFSFLLTANHSGGLAVKFTFTLRISNLAITGSGILPPALANYPYSHTFTATGGGATLVWSVQSALPAGLSLSPDGVLSGEPTAIQGFSNILVSVTDGVSTVSRRFTLFTNAPNPQVLTYPITSAVLSDAVVGQAFTFQLGPIGGVPPYTIAVASGSSLPPGLQLALGAAFSSNFSPGVWVITGVPSAAGTFSFDLIITDSVGSALRRTFTLKVSPISIVAGAIRNPVVGVPYSQQFTTVGGTPPYAYSMSPINFVAEMLPPGLTMSSSGLISGTPTATGSFNFTLTATDSIGNTFRRGYAFTTTNSANQFVSTSNLPDTSIGAGREQFLIVSTLNTATTTSFTWSVVGGALPPGMSLRSNDGIFYGPNDAAVTGRPTAADTYVYTLRATDNSNPANVVDRTFTLRVLPLQVVSPPVELSDPTLPSAEVGVAYSMTVKVAGVAPPYAFAISPFGAMPPGLTLSPAGVISGTPAEAGSFLIGILVTDANGQTHRGTTLGLFVTAPGVAPPLQQLLPDETFLSPGSVGVPYQGGALDAWIRGGRAPYSWSVNPASTLPPGIVLLQGGNGVSDRLSGTPTASNDTNVLLDVTDASGQTLTMEFELFISTLVLTPASVSPGVVGVPYSVQFVPSGGTPPYAVQLLPAPPAVSDLPPGLTLSSAGLLSGIPTHAGNFTVTVIVTDATGNIGGRMVRLTIDNAAGEAPAVSMTPRSIQVLHVQGISADVPLPIGVSRTSGTFPFTIHVSGIPGATLSASGGTTPSVLTLNLGASGLALGTYNGLIGLTAPGSANRIDEIPVTLTVALPPPCTFTLNPTSGSIAAAGGTGSFDVDTQGHCAWAATTADPFVTIMPSGSGTGAGTVSYSIAPNPGFSARNGSIIVNGQTFSITQFGSSCSFALLPPSIAATAAGGTALVDVVASGPSCAWTASSLDMAIAPGGGTGNGTVAVVVPSNSQSASRVLTATIGGQTFSVNQSGIACIVTLSPYDATMPAGGGSGSVAVNTAPGCAYNTTPGPSWISVTSGGSGVGPGTLVYSVAPNSTTVARSGSLSIGGQTFQVNQDALACSVTLTPSLANPFAAAGGAGSIAIATNGPNCSWSASSNSPWASVTPQTGTGNVTVLTTIGSNAGSASARSAEITINGQVVTLNQAGTACTFALQSTNGSVPAAGGAGSVGVIAPGVCTWTAVSNAPSWLAIISSGTGGSADVNFVAQPNLAAAPRVGTLTVAGLTYTVNQAAAACSYTTTPTLVNIAETGATAASFPFSTTAFGCAPSAVSYANWITVSNMSFAVNAGTVTFDVAANPGSTTREGSIQVGDLTFTIRQTGATCGYSLNAYGALFDKNGGAGSVLGSPSALGCFPTNGVTQSFISLEQLLGPTANVFTQEYSVPAFNVLTRVVRTGQINFGGQLFTVKQKSY